MRKGKSIQVRLENTNTWILLSDLVQAKMKKRGVRVVAKEIGISPATLSRMGNRYLDPDMGTFGKVWDWLDIGITGIRREP